MSKSSLQHERSNHLERQRRLKNRDSNPKRPRLTWLTYPQATPTCFNFNRQSDVIDSSLHIVESGGRGEALDVLAIGGGQGVIRLRTAAALATPSALLVGGSSCGRRSSGSCHRRVRMTASDAQQGFAKLPAHLFQLSSGEMQTLWGGVVPWLGLVDPLKDYDIFKKNSPDKRLGRTHSKYSPSCSFAAHGTDATRPHAPWSPSPCPRRSCSWAD